MASPSKAELESKLGSKLLMLSAIELQIWTSTFGAQFSVSRNRAQAAIVAWDAVAVYEILLKESGSVFEEEEEKA